MKSAKAKVAKSTKKTGAKPGPKPKGKSQTSKMKSMKKAKAHEKSVKQTKAEQDKAEKLEKDGQEGAGATTEEPEANLGHGVTKVRSKETHEHTVLIAYKLAEFFTLFFALLVASLDTQWFATFLEVFFESLSISIWSGIACRYLNKNLTPSGSLPPANRGWLCGGTSWRRRGFSGFLRCVVYLELNARERERERARKSGAGLRVFGWVVLRSGRCRERG